MDVLGVKTLVEHDFEGVEVLIGYRFRDISAYVMHYIYVTSGPSVLIESMIMYIWHYTFNI